jgi:hypothetical protein
VVEHWEFEEEVKLMEALEYAGFSAAEVTKLGQLGNSRLNEIRFVLNGKAKIVSVGEQVKEKVKKVLKPFLTLTTGPTTKERLIADIQANRNAMGVADEVSSYSKKMMNDSNFAVSQKVEKVSFVALAIGTDLGFTAQAQTIDFMTDEFCRTWSAENLDGYAIELCKPDDGLRIRKHWTRQPKGTDVWCAMRRLADPGCDPRVWRLECSSGGRRQLCGGWAGPVGHWGLSCRVVFRLRKIAQNPIA